MAGIWNRIIPGEDRISAHLVKAAIYLGARGVFTDQQILNGLNSKLTAPLDASAQADMAAVRTLITNASTTQAKLDILERFDALNIAAEAGVLTSEATYRTQLGI